MPDVTATKQPAAPDVSALQHYYDHQPIYRRISQRLGLQAKLAITSLMLIGATLTSYCYVSLEDSRQQMLTAWGTEARQMSASLAVTTPDLINAGRMESVRNAAHELVRSSRNVLYICLYGPDGAPLIGESQAGSFLADAVAISKIGTLNTPLRIDNNRWGAHLNCTAPLLDINHKTLGFVCVGISLAQLAERTTSMQKMALQIGAVLFLLSIPTVWLIVRRIFLPIRQLVSTVKRIGTVSLEDDIQTKRPDVIGDLARAFNEMRVTVRKQQAALKQVNQKLAEANHELENRIEQRTAQYETANRRLTMEIAEKEDFLRAVSHDLNAPLRNISGMVTMLLIKKKGLLDEDLLHRLDRIKKNVEIETDLINELLELSRIKTRRQAMENVELESLLWELRGMFENDLKTREINLVIDTQLPTLFGERARLRQVFQNLIDNAIKYMGDGPTREIHVGCQLRLSEAEFYVRDSGLGIDSEDVGKVFFIFRRGKNTAAPNVAGKGVGLASVKSIVETYNGKIWVESELGQGTTFRFTVNGQFVPATGVAASLPAFKPVEPRMAA